MANLIKQEIGFTQVKNDILQDRTLSLKAKGLFAILFSKPDGWDFSADRLQQENTDGRKTILAGLKELENKGYLARKRLGTGRVEYHLKWTQSAEKELGVEGPKVPLRHRAEKDTISNTELVSNKEIYILPEWLNKKAWDAWLAYRKERKQKMTTMTIKRQIAFLEFHKQDHTKIIARSIQNGWTGLFAMPENKPQKPYDSRAGDALRKMEKMQQDAEDKRIREENARNNDQVRAVHHSIKALADSKTMD